MATNTATNLATRNAANNKYQIDFQKKILTPLLLACEAQHKTIKPWLAHPVIQKQLGLSEHLAVVAKCKIPADLLQWVEGIQTPRLSPFYKTLLLAFYLEDAQTRLNFLQQRFFQLGFGVIGDKLLQHIGSHAPNQHDWIESVLKAWKTALDEVTHALYTLSVGACTSEYIQTCLDTHVLNARQYGLMKALREDKTLRDKKTMQAKPWYRLMYQKLTKRTEERDFKILVECGLVTMVGRERFEID